MADVVALGELLIDFTPEQNRDTTFPSYEANPGGAPANVVVALAQLGHATAMIASVGEDTLGTLLIETLEDKGVQTEGIMTTNVPTTLAFVHIAEEGERSFSFYRQPGADLMLTKAAVSKALLNEAKIVHVGSLSMTSQPAREATRFALEYASANGKIISYDPNYRPMLWKQPTEARKYMLEIMEYAHIVKISDDELNILTQQGTVIMRAQELMKQYDVRLLFITMGKQGSYCFHQNDRYIFVEAIKVDAIDTTGCGDAFFAGVLAEILTKNSAKISNLTYEDLKIITSFGNAMGAYVATKHGGIPAMPTQEKVTSFLSENK